jgi:pimeloyl-ACP methyl ester carboxylesterase
VSGPGGSSVASRGVLLVSAVRCSAAVPAAWLVGWAVPASGLRSRWSRRGTGSSISTTEGTAARAPTTSASRCGTWPTTSSWWVSRSAGSQPCALRCNSRVGSGDSSSPTHLPREPPGKVGSRWLDSARYGVGASVSLAAHIQGAELVAFPDTGHLSALERPEAFADALLAFLARL